MYSLHFADRISRTLCNKLKNWPMMVVLYIGSRNVVELNAINFIMCLQSHDPSEIIKICYSRNISCFCL